MPISISDLAHSVRSNSTAVATSISLGHAHQLMAAALGHKSLAAYQASQRTSHEPVDFSEVRYAVLDYELLEQRAQALGLAIASSPLQELIHIAFQERTPHINIHAHYEDLKIALRTQFEEMAMEDSDVVSEMANANHAGVDEVYFDYEVDFNQTPIGDTVEMCFTGHISVSADLDRPYAGHMVRIVGHLTLDRLGICCFSEEDAFVSEARLDRNWSDDADEDEEGPLPRSSKAELYADLLHLELHEAQTLVDAPVAQLDGSSGDMSYGFLIDFTEHASPEIVQKILLHHDSLCIEVWPGFFESMRDEEWPH